MRTPNFKVFDIYEARDLTVDLIVSVHRDIGILLGVIEEVVYYKNEDRITIVIGKLVTDPEEQSFYPTKTTITLEYPGNKLIKVKFPLSKLLDSL